MAGSCLPLSPSGEDARLACPSHSPSSPFPSGFTQLWMLTQLRWIFSLSEHHEELEELGAEQLPSPAASNSMALKYLSEASSPCLGAQAN